MNSPRYGPAGLLVEHRDAVGGHRRRTRSRTVREPRRLAGHRRPSRAHRRDSPSRPNPRPATPCQRLLCPGHHHRPAGGRAHVTPHLRLPHHRGLLPGGVGTRVPDLPRLGIRRRPALRRSSHLEADHLVRPSESADTLSVLEVAEQAQAPRCPPRRLCPHRPAHHHRARRRTRSRLSASSAATEPSTPSTTSWCERRSRSR